MKTLHTFLLALFFVSPTFGQERTFPPATQAEVSAGNIHNKFVAPDTLNLWSVNGHTNVGAFQGITRGSNHTYSTSSFTIGDNVDGSWLTVDGFGSTYDQLKFHAGGFVAVSPTTAGNISSLFSVHAPSENDGDWSTVYQVNSLYTPGNASVSGGSTFKNRISGGAPQNLAANYIAGSASSMVDLPMYGPEIWNAQKHPVIGVHTDVNGGVAEAGSSWALQQKIYTNLIAVSKWFNTSAWSTAISPYGIQTSIWGDSGWATNRTSTHSLQFDAQILAASGATSFSNYVYQIHTNHVSLGLLQWRTTQPYNLFNGDNAMVFVVKSSGVLTEVSYPSGAGVTNPPTVPITTPDYIREDVDFYYSNAVDKIILADLPTYGLENGYEQQLQAFAWSAMFPDTFLEDHVYWANVQSGAQGPLTGDIGSNPGVTGSLSNQLVIAAFVDNPSPHAAYLANDIATDQTSAGPSSDVGLARSMGYFNCFYGRETNWPARSGLPEMAAGFDDSDANNSGLPLLSITNYFKAALMGRMNIYWDVDTNKWSPNTNILMIANCPLFLTLWMDNTLAQPQPVFNDLTNELFVRAMDNGAFLAMGVNQASSVTNINQVISGSKSGLAYLATNEVFTATNVWEQTAFGSGLFTNSFIGSVPTNNISLVYLKPYRLAVTNAGNVLYTGPLFIAP